MWRRTQRRGATYQEGLDHARSRGSQQQASVHRGQIATPPASHLRGQHARQRERCTYMLLLPT